MKKQYPDPNRIRVLLLFGQHSLLLIKLRFGQMICHPCGFRYIPYTRIPATAEMPISAMGEIPFLRIFLDPK